MKLKEEETAKKYEELIKIKIQEKGNRNRRRIYRKSMEDLQEYYYKFSMVESGRSR